MSSNADRGLSRKTTGPVKGFGVFPLALVYALFCAVWVSGIYVNGYVSNPFSTSFESSVRQPGILVHLTLAALLALSLAGATLHALFRRNIRQAAFMATSLALVVLSGVAGFMFAGGCCTYPRSYESMAMGFGYASAFAASFLGLLTDTGRSFKAGRSPVVGQVDSGRKLFLLGAACLAFSFAVLASGLYLNLTVASEVFSLPPALAEKAIPRLVWSYPFATHVAFSSALMFCAYFFAALVFKRRLTHMYAPALLSAILVTYSGLVGLVDLALSSILAAPLEGSTAFYLGLAASMTSAAGFIVSVSVYMFAVGALYAG
ncbi:MAG: hypothetical protein QXI37_04000 [Thermoprotei archaeon]